MPRRKFNDGGEITHDDLSAVSSSLEIELYERVLFQLMNRQENKVFGDSFQVAYASATSVTVKAGVGFQTDGTQVDPEPQKRLLYVESQLTKNLSTPDASNPRIDIVCIKAERATIDTDTRKYKDLLGNVSNTTQDIETDWEAEVTIVAGTPASSPAIPSTPAGYIKLAELAVAASTGMAGAASVTDKRPVFQRPASWKSVVTKTASYTATVDDDVIFCNSASPMTITFPPAADCTGKELQIVNINSGVVTEDGDGSEQLNGSTTQTLDTQYTAHKWLCNGTAWYLVA
jgi:hypothetical protein